LEHFKYLQRIRLLVYLRLCSAGTNMQACPHTLQRILIARDCGRL